MKHCLLTVIILLMTPVIGASAQDTLQNVIPWSEPEIKPMLDGRGFDYLSEWIMNHQKYPGTARKLGIEGRVIVSFYITETGKVTDVKVHKSTHKSLDRASVRLIKSTSGKWTPGSIGGKPKKVRCNCPVIWKLPEL